MSDVRDTDVPDGGRPSGPDRPTRTRRHPVRPRRAMQFLDPGPSPTNRGRCSARPPRATRSCSRRSGHRAGELRREVGAVLRLPEGVAVDPSDIDVERSDDETMIINMGPQHPSTHGVLRLMLELDGETVLRTKPVIGYLHTGMEKTGEELTYVQGSTNVTRMDYLSPLHNELVFSMAIEALLGVEMPPAVRLDPDAAGRAQPGLVPSHVDGHQRHGPRVDVDDDLRVPRAGDGPGLLREGDRVCG